MAISVFPCPPAALLQDMKQLLPATFELIFWSALFMVGGSLILGRAAARHRDGILDSIIRVFSYIGIAVPSFVVAIVLLVIFGNLAGNPNAWAIEYRGGTATPSRVLMCWMPWCRDNFPRRGTRSSICCCPRLPFLWAVCSRMHG